MINRNTARALDLKILTHDMCYGLYVKLNSEMDNRNAIREAVSWCQGDSEKLNHLWWVLNYYAEQFDPDRLIRANIERHLDALAREKQEPFEE